MKLNELLDPRGVQERPMIELAKRPTIEELQKGKILFYNNTKLGFCNYYTVFDRIKERLTELGITNYVEYTETVRGKNQERLYEYAAMLAEEKPTAAIVAFGDMGTSSSTTVMFGCARTRSVTRAEKPCRSTARQPPASTRVASAQHRIKLPSLRSSSFSRPTAFSSRSPRREFEQTSSAKSAL